MCREFHVLGQRWNYGFAVADLALKVQAVGIPRPGQVFDVNCHMGTPQVGQIGCAESTSLSDLEGFATFALQDGRPMTLR